MAVYSSRGTRTSSRAHCGMPCSRSRNGAHLIHLGGSERCRELVDTLRGPHRLQAHLVCNLLPQDILRDFPRYRHGKPVEEAHVPRYFEPCNLAHAELTDLGNSCLRTGTKDDAGAELLAVPRIRNAHHLHVLHFRMAVEKLLDLARVYVLSTANHHVLRTPDDVAIAILVQRSEIPGVHPAFGVNRFAALCGVVPVAQHDRVTSCQHLAGRAARNRVSRLFHDLHLHMRLDEADRQHSPLGRVVDGALEADRRGLRHPVGDRDLAHVHTLHNTLHHLDRTRRSRHDARAQTREVVLIELWMLEQCDEHRRDTMKCRATLGLDGIENRAGLEPLAWEDHRGTMRNTRKVANHHAEAMVEGHRDTHSIVTGQ